jgi:hypothetical protein
MSKSCSSLDIVPIVEEQTRIAAMLDAIAENQPDFHLIELLVMPLFMAEADALSS